jgi:hypothetical protein
MLRDACGAAGGPVVGRSAGTVARQPLCYAATVNTAADNLQLLAAALERAGFLFVDGPRTRDGLRALGSLDDWYAFAASWNDLAPDAYLADYGRYRRRRHATYYAIPPTANDAAKITRRPHQPHYQSREYNALQGGIERWFDPVLPQIGSGASLLTILRFCLGLFGQLAADVPRWLVEVHQFRIEARDGEPGQPTPEGVHRDGVDYVLVLMIRRTNIAQGTTTIHAPDATLLGSFTLAEPFDAALVDDHRVFHGVTPVEPLDAEKPAYRDVLVVTFRRERG